MGIQEIRKIFETLKSIKTNLVKLRIEKRKPHILEAKLNEAKTIYAQLNNEVSILNQKIKNAELDTKDIEFAKNFYISNIKSLYKEIAEFCSKIHGTNDTDDLDNIENINMASFDLKTAVSLVPVMDDTENITNKIIDAIELYETMLSNEGKPLLINFILKTRLSSSAKLKLLPTYNDIPSLVSDMKKYLLTRKSDTALQSKLMRARQGDKSIEQFGKELEEIFVNLTIAQANGNSASYAVLKPINEKMALKRFADGLRNQRLSTIIASRNFEFLKDAIRAAQDEEVSLHSSPQVFNFSSRGRGRFNSLRGNFRGRQFNSRNNNFSNFSRQQLNNNSNNNFCRGRDFSNNGQGRNPTRANYNTNNRRGSRPYRRSLNFAELNNSSLGRENNSNNNNFNSREDSVGDLCDKFFRL